ncbi:MAG: hypothetical protein FGM15_12215 [Chthoniobacterales bacterium]|nr:hypothetical protein [Chthoniobacterales bacterium]
MQLLTLERGQTTRLFWALAAVLAAVGILTAKQDDPVITGAAILLGLVCFSPFYFWMLGWAPGLPIWPVFAMMTGVTTVLPMMQDVKALADFSPDQVVTGAVTTLIFVLAGTLAWLSLSSRPRQIPREVLMIAREHADWAMLMFIVSAILFDMNAIGGWVQFPGNTMPVVRSLTGSLSSMGVFVLGFYMGRGFLNPRTISAYLALVSLHVLLSCTSLMLASAFTPVALAFLGYVLGSNKMPWTMMLLAFVTISMLHAGKWEMRQRYWAEGTQSTTGGEAGERLSLLGLPQFFAEWVGYGAAELGGVTGAFAKKPIEDDAQSVFERAGILHMLLIVQKNTPQQIPYLSGATYTPIPRLLIPRFLDDQKGISHVANVMLSINYGVLSIEGAQNTSVGWGLVAEAFANFGYLGVLVVGACLGMFHAMVTRLTVGVPMTSLRFVIGLLIMAAATKADTMSVFVTMQFQGVLGVSVASLFLMRRQQNPFAEERGGVRQEARGKWGSAYARSGYGVTSGRRAENGNGVTSGMPSAGVLTGLIEGVPDGRADESLKDERLRDQEPEGVGKWEGMNVGGWERGQSGAETKSLRDEETEGVGRLEPETTAAADGLLVRSLPIKTPKRVAAWMPRRVREQVVAQQRAAAEERRRK